MEQNTWYVYADDIYGVNGLLNFPSKEALVQFFSTEDFVSFAGLPEGISAENTEKYNKIIANFADGTIECIALGEQLSTFIKANDGEVCILQIEDFERLCTGKSAFSEMVILTFCEMNEHDPCTSISKEMESQFRDFFVNAEDVWIG